MSSLNYTDIMASIAEFERLFPKREPSIFDPLRFTGPMGMRVFEEPEPPPKIQVRDIKLSDGTSILSQAFRDDLNARLAEEFGYRESICKNNMYIIDGFGIIAGPGHIAMLRSLSI